MSPNSNCGEMENAMKDAETQCQGRFKIHICAAIIRGFSWSPGPFGTFFFDFMPLSETLAKLYSGAPPFSYAESWINHYLQ